MQKYKATGHLTLFDEEERQQRLSKIGNPLDKLSKVIDFEMFRNELEDAVLNKGRIQVTNATFRLNILVHDNFFKLV